MVERDLRELLEPFTGDDPSPEVVDRIWRRLDSELSGDAPPVTAGSEEVAIVALGEQEVGAAVRRPRWMIGALAAAVVLVVVGVLSVVLDDGDEPVEGVDSVAAGSEGEPTGSTGQASSTSEPERSRPRVTPLLSGQPQQTVVGDITWTRIEGTSLPTRVFAGVDGGFIGLDPLGNANTVWRSADGIEWEELTGPRVADQDLFIDDTEELPPADPPPSAAPYHDYVVFDGGLMALSAISNESGWGLAGVELWTRADGADTWEPVEVPVPSGTQIDASHISSNGSQVLLSIVSSDSPGGDPQRYEAWSTTDGNNWEAVDLDAGDGVAYWRPESTSFGWMAFEPDARPRGVAVSADGLTWQKIPYSDVTNSMPGGTSILATAVGRTIFAISADPPDYRVMLVGQVADQ